MWNRIEFLLIMFLYVEGNKITNDEIVEWLKDNIKPVCFGIPGYVVGNGLNFFRETDAVAFKLRWC